MQAKQSVSGLVHLLSVPQVPKNTFKVRLTSDLPLYWVHLTYPITFKKSVTHHQWWTPQYHPLPNQNPICYKRENSLDFLWTPHSDHSEIEIACTGCVNDSCKVSSILPSPFIECYYETLPIVLVFLLLFCRWKFSWFPVLTERIIVGEEWAMSFLSRIANIINWLLVIWLNDRWSAPASRAYRADSSSLQNSDKSLLHLRFLCCSGAFFAGTMLWAAFQWYHSGFMDDVAVVLL